MRILNRYLLGDFLVVLLISLSVVTFVMSIAAVFGMLDLVARGVSAVSIGRILLFNLPYIMSFSIPISVLTSVLLQFSRLSMDGEITAMRACGISLWQISTPIIVASILLSFFCLYLNSYLAPEGHHARRKAVIALSAADPLALVEQGRWIRFRSDESSYALWMGKKDGRAFEDITVFEQGDRGARRTIRARHGTMDIDREEGVLHVDLYDARIDQPGQMPPFIAADFYPLSANLSDFFQRTAVERRTSSRTLANLIHAVHNMEEVFPELADREEELRRMRTKLLVETNKRMSLAIACFAFAMLGIPLGMTNRRRESSAGILISILLVFLFYFFILTAEALSEHPQWRPELLVWLPVVLAELIGFMLIKRIE